MKLTAKIMSVLLITVVIFTAVASYFSVRSAYEEFRANQQQLARQFGRQLHDRLATAMQTEGPAGVVRLLDQLAAARDRGVTVRWVWFERSAPAELLPHGRPEYWTTIRIGQVVSVISQDAIGRRQLHTYLPLQTGSGRLGGLEITDSLAEVERQARQTAWNALITIGALGMVCIGITYLAGLHWVAHPLKALIDKTKRIGEGDFSKPLQLGSNDELSQLGEALNQMCEKLVSQQQRIASESTQRLAVVEQLRHADRLKTVGRLAAGLAHELGTPLNVVAGRASLIASGKLSDSEVTESARTIKSEADRITGIVRQLLDFARQRPPHRQRVEVCDLVKRTLHMLQPLADKKQIVLATHLPDEPVIADVDDGQLQQVVTNIVMNAIQVMTQPGEVQVHVDRRERSSPAGLPTTHWARIGIVDQGPGIAADVREQMFEPFFTTKDVGEGTGLGLSIAYGIVQEHGGWIDVHSESGRGARFDIYVPQEDLSCQEES